MFNPIELTTDTIEIYEEALENGSYEDETYATNEGRMVTLVNPRENSRYRYYLRTVDGRYLSEAKTTEEAIKFLMTGEYYDVFACEDKVWKK